ncbi:NAD-dependent epimerase/dehydratase family protein [Variovorax sp. PCZ-1]|uniref:NAD-dependent epimerase/dehydratase family protein n=1 Tax=Variovorax sp. PCZ-1 TaxID=2835533 RepID=UPI001BD0A963|nr:NAD-dependent epimerase/dehydratase family protein [Variovorax sp. PCZ-1]MBS7807874.1 NAD(P)H-binding protein [Variovorax sp. PCZ-1]
MVALIAGASGLVGKELLALLLSDSACREVHSLVRKPSPQNHAKLQSHVVDFAKLGTASAQALPVSHIDEVYISLGTTIKVAGSQEAFRAVDFDAVLAVARTGLARGATKIGVISAMGASSASGVFYNRVKGEMEDAISKLGYPSVTIARPSFLAGDREALNQNARPGEKIALVAMNLFNPLIPSNYKAIEASDVASSLLRQVRKGVAGKTVLPSGQMQIH